jgi:SAM-dependent methyltransferase
MKRPRQDDQEVRCEYADPSRFAARAALWSRRTGPRRSTSRSTRSCRAAPRRAAGCGRGEFAARLLRHGIDVAAVDQFERMVGLSRECGVDARVGDVQDLPFDDREFDLAAADFTLYHVPDLDRALVELARVAPRLVAATIGRDQLREMWELVGRDLGERRELFLRENGGRLLRKHFDHVTMVDLPATVEITADDMRRYIANSVAHRDLAARVPEFAGMMAVTAHTAVFIAQ